MASPRAVLALALASPIAACSIWGFDGLSGGAEPPDASTPSADAPSDAGADGPWCEQNGRDAQACDDFDTPGTFTGRWTETDDYLGRAAVEAGILRVSTEPSDQATVAFVGYSTDVPASEVDCEVSVRLVAVPSDATVYGPLAITFDGDPPSGYRPLGLYLFGNELLADPQIYDSNGNVVSGDRVSVGSLTAGRWTHLRVHAEVGRSPPRMMVYVDGALALEKAIEGFEPRPFRALFGVGFAKSANAPLALDLDNARVLWR